MKYTEFKSTMKIRADTISLDGSSSLNDLVQDCSNLR
ncbi:hypothetical protein BMETH_1263_0 [methanotrophic bacterial endosymbiont of Bathymodiolus sp.]|nr:hypothetical protein BMETH_1263_0 [methanotrophic bacterial endosymbiont of Bathymodiolus sp.]